MQQPVDAFPSPMNITTEQIQKYLEENKQLIMAILESKNLGKSAECALYQTQLQNNLTYLAKIADAQPQAPKIPCQLQMLPQSSEQQEHYMCPTQAARLPLPLNNQQQQQQQLIQGQMGMRPGTSIDMYQAIQTGSRSSFMNIQKVEQDFLEGGAGDGLGKSAKYNSGNTEA